MHRALRGLDWNWLPPCGVLIGGLLPAVTFRGPLFGLIFGLACSAPFALVVGAFVRRSTLSNRPRRALVLGTVLSAMAVSTSYLAFRPPSGTQVLWKHLGLNAAEVRNVRSWADLWGPDPAYAVRFRIDADRVARAVADAGLVPQSGPPDPQRRQLEWRASPRMPAWWTPPQDAPGSIWTRPPPADPVLRLGYDSDSGLAYLLVIYH